MTRTSTRRTKFAAGCERSSRSKAPRHRRYENERCRALRRTLRGYRTICSAGRICRLMRWCVRGCSASAERQKRSAYGSDALDVAAFGGVDLHFVAVVYKRRHVDDQAGFEGGGLHDGAGGGLLQRRLRVGHSQVNRIGQQDAHGLAFIELDAHRHVGDEVVGSIAERALVERDLLVGLRVHEVVADTVGVEEFEFHFVHDGALDEILSAEAVIDDRAAAQVAHFGLHGAALVPGGAVLDAEYRVQLAFVLNNHAGAQLCCFDHDDAPRCWLGIACRRSLEAYPATAKSNYTGTKLQGSTRRAFLRDFEAAQVA